VVLLSLNREDFLFFLKMNPEATLKLLEVMSIKLRNTNELLLERRQMEEKLRYLGQHDPLTGIYNRTFFQEVFKHFETESFPPIGLIMCDVDGLKLINDTLGHEAGDFLLSTAANVIKHSFRENDIVARIGGDEFAVLLPNTSLLTVEDGCRRIRDGISHYNENNTTMPIGISVGFSFRKEPEKSNSDLFKEADASMYRQKQYSSHNTRKAVIQKILETYQQKIFNPSNYSRIWDLVTLLSPFPGFKELNLADFDLLLKYCDVGSSKVIDHLLNRPESQVCDDDSEIQRHCEVGYRIAQYVPELLLPIADLILKHHEYWNGQGYPTGLIGPKIPLECRILAICDAYDTMINQTISAEEAKGELRKYAGIKFDPHLVEKFIWALKK
jgi:diguanylate cyclase (GGDEF)-like protein